MSELGISLDKVCFVILTARAFDVQEDAVTDNDGSNPIDEDFREILAAHGDDQARLELQAAIDGLNEDEQCALVALAWVGRGDFDPEQWPEAVRAARARRTGPTSRYLLGIPVLSDYLQEGLPAFGLSCVDFSESDAPP